jgi:serine/threonine protein kinase/tetratricopeptide (TPR) repeat protein
MASQSTNPRSMSRSSWLGSTEADDPLMLEAAALAQRLAASWRRGVCCRAEDLLAEHPSIASEPRAAVRVIYEEVCQRQERGQEVPLAELRERFPQWQDELAVILDCHRLLELTPTGARFPEIGDTLGQFRILTELGRGGIGRVYLAEQTFLAGRLMILKVTPCHGQEHLQLARLQHTHIVPLYSVRDFPERNLRKMCMPCLGGATLLQVLATLHDIPNEQRTGSDLIEALPKSVPDVRLCWPSQGPGRRFLDKASYVQAVCWIGVCIADALHYAHEQGLVHLDVKPSNILLTADFQPMLLDFHLSRGPIRPNDDPQWIGGTPSYMSPEQHAAWAAYRKKQPISTPIDARSDLYSLGALLRELLYGRSITESILPPRADVSPGLCDIIGKCLHTEVGQRYASAAQLAEDLRRHLTHRPLVGVRNRSFVERWRKWRRRWPHALLLSLLLTVCLFGTVALAGMYATQSSQHREQSTAALNQGRQQVKERRFAEAVRTFDEALVRSDAGPLRAELLRARQRAARAHDVAAVHHQFENSRYLLGDDVLAGATLQALQSQCRHAWDARQRLLDTGGEPLDVDYMEENLRRDLLDAAVVWSECHVRLATPATIQQARREALELLDEAEALFGPSPVIRRQQHALGRAAAERPESVPRTAWEHYALGRWLLRNGNLTEAAEAFEQAVDMRPQDLWPWFGKGQCALRRQQCAEAIAAFSVCVALAPDSAACYYNRGLALAAHGDAAAALRDYDRALQRDPRLGAAALNRGALHLQERHFAEAEADLKLALTLGANPAATHYNLALVNVGRGDSAAALASIRRALEYDPEHRPARELEARLAKSFGKSSP